MRLRDSFVWRRAGSARLLLSSVLLSTLIAASLSSALAGFATTSLPQAVSGELAHSPRTPIIITGSFGAAQARTDGPAVRDAVRRAFGPIRFAMHEGLWSDPIDLPAPRHAKVVPLLQAAALGQVRAHVVVVSGSWPGRPVPGAPVPAIVPTTVADALHLVPGGVLRLRDRSTGAQVRFRLTGLYRPADPAAPYWGLDLIGTSGVSVQSGFTTYGPLLVAPGAFASGGIAIGGATWLVLPDAGHISAPTLRPLAARVAGLQAYLTRSPNLGGLQVSTGLVAALTGLATKLVVARSLITIGALELLLLAGTVLALTARTLASHRAEESAVLSARGAGRWQLARLAITEALLVTAVAATAGGLAGSRLAGLLASSGPLRSLGLRVHGTPASVWLTAGTVLLLCLAIMMLPMLRPGTPGAVRVRKGRQAAVAIGIRAGGDASLVLLAVLIGWQLRRYSALSRTGGSLGIDPALAVAPAIALAAAAVLPLRLLPLLARACDRLAARTRKLGTAMASWEISRRAVRQSAVVLLIVLAVGTCTLALAQHQTWHQSAVDQASFTVGADARVQTPVPVSLGHAAAISRASGVTAAMPVTSTLTTADGGQVLAIDASSASTTVLMRADESALPLAALWRRIIPARTMQGITLPGHPARLELIASLNPGSKADLGQVLFSLSIQDATGAVYTVPTGQLREDGRSHGLVADLSATRQAIYPLRLLAISVSYTLPAPPPRALIPAADNRTSALTLHGLAVSARRAGAFGSPFALGRSLANWTPALSAIGLADSFATGLAPALSHLQQTSAGAITLLFHPGYGGTSASFGVPLPPYGPVAGQLTLTGQVPFSVIPGIATTAFLGASQLAVGDLIQVQAGQATIPVRIVAAIRSFPTITAPAGGLIVDQAAAQDLVAGQSQAALTVGQWWLATANGSLPVRLPAGTLTTSRAQVLSALQADPLSLIPQRAVQSIAVAAALIAIIGLAVSIVGRARERRSQSALLSAFGLGGTTQARLLGLEIMTLSVPAAATGLVLGTVLARLLVPAVTLTATGTAPVPPALVEIPMTAAAGIALAIAAIPVAIAAATAARKPDAAAELRAAESI